MNETFLIVVDSKEFTFKALPGFVDERRIRSEMASILKHGLNELLDLEDAIHRAYDDHLTHNRERLGIEEFDKVSKRYQELLKLQNTVKGKEKENLDKEYEKVTVGWFNNKHFARFIELSQERSFLEDYACMKVTCIAKPKDFEFNNSGKEVLPVMNKWREKKNLLKATGN